ncbi:uncharacterized protein LOC113874687 [Abrus precatorius]|uniref:Uncharacterized protein LOC113874687 n=1 Tax=Abrus precatorius TaxID=3816 RepID=A0A8B8MM67_ABRPR|nr:uncharacterized protein LOC113874687 [Abrus precatorius]
MRVEKEATKGEGGYVGGFFQLFDWTSKSRKKLFATKSDSPESLKQRRKIDGNLAMTHPFLVDEDDIGVGISIRDSNDHSYASSVIDDEVCGTRAPSVVAKLMGLDSLPSSSLPDPYFDSQSLQDVQYWKTNHNHLHGHQILYSGKLIEQSEGSSRNFMETKPQKTLSRPIEKFQTEVMPPKSAKSIPVTHHKLLSPIKSPGFVPANNATYIMEAAARIIEPRPLATAKAKTPLVASSIVSLRIRDLKDKVETSQKGPLIGSSSLMFKVRDLKEKREIPHRTSRFFEPSQGSAESNYSKHLKGQSFNKSWNGSADAPLRYLTEEGEHSFLKNKGKSVSLAIQAKVNVQRREKEGLSLGGAKSLVDEKEHCDIKTHQLWKANVRKSLQKKPYNQDASGVLRQNNLKQNCSTDKDKLPFKPLVSSLHSRKLLTGGDSSHGRHRSSSSKSIAKSKAGSKKSSMHVTDSEKEVLYTRTNNFPRKKRSTDRDWNDRVVDNLFIDKTQKLVQSKVSNEHHSWAEEVKKKDTDVVSFTFSMPLTRSSSGFETSEQAGLKTNGLLDQHIERGLLDTDSTRFPVGYNGIGGDALGILLEQKLRELTCGVENSCDDSFKAWLPSSTPPTSKDLVPTLNSVNLIPQLQQKKEQDVTLTEKLFGSPESDISYTCLPELSYKHRLGVDEMGECKSNLVDAELFNSRQPSSMSVLDPSFSTESCESSFHTNDSSAEDQNRRKQVVGFNSSRRHYPTGADIELFDSACSASAKKHTNAFSQMKFGCSSSRWELDYVNDVLCNVELMYMDFALGRARDIVNPHLFNQLESRKGRSESDGGKSRMRRKVIFDCVSECLDLRCRRYVGGGYKMWAKGVAMVRRNEWLAKEVYKEISSWRDMGDSMVDELVDRDMCNPYGRWLDFEVDTFELGAKVEDQIFNSLVDDFVAEIL